VELMQNARS